MTLLLLATVLCAAPAPLPDLPAPLGRLIDVLGEPSAAPVLGEKVVMAQLASCDHKVPINVTHFAAGAAYAVQQLKEWMAKTKGLEETMFKRKDTLAELITMFQGSTPADVHMCSPPGKKLSKAPKLCPEARGGESWLVNKAAPAVFVSWVDTKECLPKITAVMFDTQGVARLIYTADFGGDVEVKVLGDKCANVELKLGDDKQVFHAERRGC